MSLMSRAPDFDRGHHWANRIGLLLALLVLASCGTAGSSVNASNDTPILAEWHLIQVTQGSLGLTLGEGRPPFTLELREDGTARGRVACNTWTGQSRLSPDLLRLQRIQATRRACALDDARVSALARRYLSALQAASRYEVDGNTLTLALANGEIWQFSRQ